MSTFSPLTLTLLAVLAGACTSANTPGGGTKTQPDGKAQADAIADARTAAREGVVADLYEQWRYDFVMYRKALADTLARSAEPAEPTSPVRSLEDLLRASDPELRDPEARKLHEQWVAKSHNYDARLRQLASDPEADPRSPLREEVRSELDPTKPQAAPK